ncbi:PP2C family protein-serine/threonine phosphatase [Streptosporangium sp. NPDC048047]|uniref:PP2C family protein-serine/threonine phosphatase n=1 Tax=Streptosporangium sp. NPDC048047 TaxID=3155748 RepID=UPI003424DDB2
MDELTLLIVGGPEEGADGATHELTGALAGCGNRPVLSSGPEVLSGAHDALEPDLLLLHASMTAQEVALVGQKWQHLRTPPGVLLFCGPDHVPLDAHLGHELGFLVPPFTPALVRNRLEREHQRRLLVRTAAELGPFPAFSFLQQDRDLKIGRQIQQGFLPPELPCPDGWEVAAGFEPAREVSGDFYDGFSMANGRRTAFLVADVCDKGIGAALFMALVRTLLRFSAQNPWAGGALAPFLLPSQQVFLSSPSIGALPLLSTVHAANGYLTANHLQQAYFVTLFFCVTDPGSGRLLYINAGHNPPILLRGSGGHRLLRTTGPAVGLWPDAAFTIAGVTLGPSDTLFLYTDGVTEARNGEGELFGLPRLVRLLSGMPGAGAADMVGGTLAEVQAHTGRAPQSDDITMLALRRRR